MHVNLFEKYVVEKLTKKIIYYAGFIDINILMKKSVLGLSVDLILF